MGTGKRCERATAANGQGTCIKEWRRRRRQFLRGSWRLKGRLIREAMFKDGLHLLKSIFELPFPFD